MKTIEINLYKFEELSDEAKKKAIQECQENEYYLDYEWWDGIYEDATTIAGLMGIEIDKIYFNGFWSQGDGACFVGDYRYKTGALKAVKKYAPLDTYLHTIAERLQKLQKRYFYQLTATIKHRGHYYHENSNEIIIDTLNSDRYISDDTDEELTDILRDYMRWIYTQLNNEYDYLMSDESVSEHLIANEYEFTENGERY